MEMNGQERDRLTSRVAFVIRGASASWHRTRYTSEHSVYAWERRGRNNVSRAHPAVSTAAIQAPRARARTVGSGGEETNVSRR